MKKAALCAALCSLALSPIPLFARAPAPDLPAPLRLDATGPALESMAAALDAAPDQLEAIAEFNRSGTYVAKNGFTRKLQAVRDVRLSAADMMRPGTAPLAGGTVTRSARESLVWTSQVQVAAAHGLRLHLTGVAVPEGTRAWVYGAGGKAVPLSARLLARGGDLWSGVVFGDRIWLAIEVPGSAFGTGAEARFSIDSVLEIVALDDAGRPLAGSPVAEKNHCFVDEACALEDYPEEILPARDAVGRLLFVTGQGGFVCTGSLLADAEPLQISQRAFFLTASHCISDQPTAETAAVLFRFWREACGDPATRTPDQASGADLLATVETSDSTLLELDALPPNPKFLPWSPDPHESDVGRLLHVISHPGGGPQVFSRHRAVAECVNNEGAFSTKATYGGVTGGSSGAPLLNADGEVIGQLWGGCAYVAIDDTCDPENFIFFGKLSFAYSTFAPFLEAPPPPPENEYFTDPAYPDWKFRVVITGGSPILGTHEPTCLPETVCVSGALAGRAEVFIRVVGPKPNGKLWPTLVKFTTSQVDVWIRQLSTGEEKHYTLAGASPGVDELPGLFDRGGFEP